MIVLKMAIRNIFRHRTRSIITLSSIAFGCIALIFVGGYFEDVFYKMRESYIHGHTGHIQVFRKGYFEKGAAKPFDYLIDNAGAVEGIIKGIKGVKFVTARLEFAGLISTGDTTVSFIGQGVEPANENAVLFSETTNARKADLNATMSGLIVESGEPLDNNVYGVVAGKGLAAGMGVKPGDGLILITNTVGGSINAMDVVLKGIFVSSSKQFDDHFVRLPIVTAKKLLHTESVQSLVVMLGRTEDTIKVKNRLNTIFKDRNFDPDIKTWDELSDFYTKTVELFNKLFLVLKVVVAIIVILGIFNTLNMAVLERTSEIGTIMALGTKRRKVLELFIYEGLGLGFIGGMIGIVSGVAITDFIAYVGIPMPPPPNTSMPWICQPKVSFSVVIFALALSVITALISAVYPAYKASRLEIAEALRHT